MAKTKKAEPLDLRSVSEDALQAELQRREGIRRALKLKELEQQKLLVRDHVAVLLQFVDQHDCTYCSDEIPSNGYATHGCNPFCRRCCLLNIQNDGYNYDIVATIQLMARDPDKEFDS